MSFNFDTAKLRALLIDFYNFTQTPITIFDGQFNEVVAYPDFLPAYCAKIREDEKRHQSCLQSDINACKRCSLLRESVSYTCHAGITETVTPVYYENIIVGYILFGQYNTSDTQSCAHIRPYTDAYNLDYSEMKGYYRQLRVMTNEQVQSAINILKLCISKIWFDEMIKFDDNIFITKIEMFIADNIRLPLTTEFLCKQFYTNRKQLYKIFAEHFNMTVKEYVLKKKLDYAKSLLKTTEKSITQIAELSGFSDYNNFIQRFKKQNGITPLQYRKKEV